MFKQTLKLLISIVFSLILLSLFTVVYNYTGAHIKNKERYTDYKWESKQFYSVMSEGYSWFFFDEYGFNNKFPYKKGNTPLEKRDIDILLMGSSHMEAVHVAPDKNVGYLLNMELPDYYTYNIGIASHYIYRCFNNIEFAVKTFKPKKYVIVETGSVDFSVNEIEKVNNGTYPILQSYDKGLFYLISKSLPATKLLYKKIKQWKSIGTHEIKQQSVYNDHYLNLVDAFIFRAVNIVNKNGAKLIIAYHPLSQIDRNGKIVETTNQQALKVLTTICKKYNVIFVDCTIAANKLYAQEHRLIHGFSNSGVGEGHLNEDGHQLMATEIVKEVKRLD